MPGRAYATRVQADVYGISAALHRTVQVLWCVIDRGGFHLLPRWHVAPFGQGCGVLRNADSSRRHAGHDDELGMEKVLQ